MNLLNALLLAFWLMPFAEARLLFCTEPDVFNEAVLALLVFRTPAVVPEVDSLRVVFLDAAVGEVLRLVFLVEPFRPAERAAGFLAAFLLATEYFFELS